VNRKALMIAVGVGSGLLLLAAQQPTASGVFTLAQAEAGRVAYENSCGKCHTPSLLGRIGKPGELPPVKSLSASYQQFIGVKGFVPPLAGKTFVERWGDKTAGQLVARFQETVDFFDVEGGVRETTVNITAYVLQVNGAKAGNQALTRSTGAVVRQAIH